MFKEIIGVLATNPSLIERVFHNSIALSISNFLFSQVSIQDLRVVCRQEEGAEEVVVMEDVSIASFEFL